MPGVFLMWLDAPEMAAKAKPGQFVMVTCDSTQERLLRRPISIHRANAASVALLFANVGAGTDWLAKRKPEDKVDMLGPVGNGFSIDKKSRNILLVAGGMGVAPMCYLSQEALDKDLKVRLLIGARTACQVCPAPLIPHNCKVITATEDGTAGTHGLVTALLPEHVEWADQVFICGPLPMFKAIAKNYGKLFADKPAQVSLEVRMGCGMGFCYACTIKTVQGLKQVCKDGPVFEMRDIMWDELR